MSFVAGHPLATNKDVGISSVHTAGDPLAAWLIDSYAL